MSLLRYNPLGPLWTFWSFVDGHHAVTYTLLVMGGCTALVMLVLWGQDRGEFTWIKHPFCGLSPSQIRAGLTLMLPVTFHLSPLILAFMLLYQLARAARRLARVLIGAESLDGDTP